jgi:flagellar assembly protein FliH
MSDFSPGFASRHHDAGIALQRAFAVPEPFAPADIAAIIAARASQHAAPPRHFHPADPDRNPTEGWDPFDPAPTPDHGFIDPVAAAHAAGYAEGLAAAQAETLAAKGREVALLDQVSAALATGAHFDRERMAGHLRQTVLHLVTRMVGEIGVAPDILIGRIDTAVDLLADNAESAILRMHPDDVPLVAGKLPGTIFPVGDAALARGGFVIESASTIVEDGPDMWLEQLAIAIDRVPIPPIC